MPKFGYRGTPSARPITGAKQAEKEIDQVMSRIKVVIVAVFAVAALSAAVAGSASADWFVNGAKLSGSAKLSTAAAVDQNAVLNLPVQGIKIECTGSLLKGTLPEIKSPNTGQASSLVFEGCKAIEPKTCKLEKETVPTQPIIATATLAGATEDRVAFKPKTGKQFAEIEFAETGCALSGAQPVNGAVNIKAPTGQTEELAQAIEGLGSVENNSLEVGGGNKAFIEGGKALVTLQSGSKWSFK